MQTVLYKKPNHSALTTKNCGAHTQLQAHNTLKTTNKPTNSTHNHIIFIGIYYAYLYPFAAAAAARGYWACVGWCSFFMSFLSVSLRVIHIHRHTGLIRIEASSSSSSNWHRLFCLFLFCLCINFCPHTTYVNLFGKLSHSYTHTQTYQYKMCYLLLLLATNTTVCACTDSLVYATQAHRIHDANTLATNGIHAADHIAFCTMKITIGSNKTKQSVHTKEVCRNHFYTTVGTFA